LFRDPFVGADFLPVTNARAIDKVDPVRAVLWAERRIPALRAAGLARYGVLVIFADPWPILENDSHCSRCLHLPLNHRGARVRKY
jgi:hypothetical protein